MKNNNKYKNKETGDIESIDSIKRGFAELLGNSNEFNEYKDNLNQYLNDFYEEVENE